MITPQARLLRNHRHLRAEAALVLVQLHSRAILPEQIASRESPAACPGKASKQKVKLLTFWSLVPQKKTLMSNKDSLIYAGWLLIALARRQPA